MLDQVLKQASAVSKAKFVEAGEDFSEFMGKWIVVRPTASSENSTKGLNKRIFKIQDNCGALYLKAVAKGASFQVDSKYIRNKCIFVYDLLNYTTYDNREALFKQLLDDDSFQLLKFHTPETKFNPKEMRFTNINGEKNMLNTVVNSNKEAAKRAATQIATRSVIEAVLIKLEPSLPEGVSEFLDTPIGTLVFANAANVALQVGGEHLGYKGREAAHIVVDAMMINAMTDVMQHFDLPGLIESVMSITEVKELINAEAQ